MTDEEVIEKVRGRVYFDSSYLANWNFITLWAHPYFHRVLVRYTRWLERVKYDPFWHIWLIANFEGGSK